jgi:hypothetical protein
MEEFREKETNEKMNRNEKEERNRRRKSVIGESVIPSFLQC